MKIRYKRTYLVLSLNLICYYNYLYLIVTGEFIRIRKTDSLIKVKDFKFPIFI